MTALLLLMVLTAAAREGADPVPCAGHWRGEGFNTDHEDGWTIDVVLSGITPDRSCGTVEYTSPDCGGSIADCRIVDEYTVEAMEIYSHKDTDCAPPGRLVLTCDTKNETLRYRWIGWETVDSTLTRVGDAPAESRAPSSVSATPAPSDAEGAERPDPALPGDPGGSWCGCSTVPLAVGLGWWTVFLIRRRP